MVALGSMAGRHPDRAFRIANALPSLERHEARGEEISEADAELAQRRARLRGLLDCGHWGDWGKKPTVEEAKAELARLEGDDRG